MSKHTVGGFAALLIVMTAVAIPIRAQDPPGVAEAAPAAVAAPRDAGAQAEPSAIEPDAAAPKVPLPKTPAPKAPGSTVATPAAAKPAAPRPVVAKPAVAKPAPVVSIQGKLELVAGQKQRVDAGEVAEGLIYFLPKAGNPKPKPGFFTVRTHSKGFSPSLLVVPAGSTIAFPNRDTVLHNVFSRTPGATFDLGNYGPGQSRQQVFAKPGLITVNCNVHYTMRAMVVVMATPYYTRPDKNGRFELTGLPSGPGTLVYWHPRTAAATTQISLPNATAQKQTLVATKPRSDHHAGTH
jgi:plastocyanin